MFFYKRIYYIWILCLIISLVLIGRMFFLQIISNNEYVNKSLNMRVREIPIEIARGDIRDRNGIAMTNTSQSFSLLIFPDQIEKESDITKLIKYSDYDRQGVINKIAERRPFKLKTNIDAITAENINNLDIPGVFAVAEKIRYNYTAVATHLIGYINKSDNKGLTGIEEMYNDMLRGNKSQYIAALVDATQEIIPGLGYKKLQLSGGNDPYDIVLTIDSNIQKKVETIMDKYIKKGAIVIMKPGTGEIMAMCSRPNFDANNISEYFNYETAPLLNRAISGYQPGSVFKLAVAAIALEEGAVRPTDVFQDKGYIDVNGLRFRGWDFDKGPRGKISFTDALAYSSNPVLIEVAQRVGSKKVIDFSYKLGFGMKSKLDFNDEDSGNLPNPANMYPGDLANLAIGQGELEATPIQIAVMVSTFVNDGIKPDPIIISKIISSEGKTIKSYPLSKGERIVSKQTAKDLKDMMLAVTKYGTGQLAWAGNGTAGKTGSAETGQVDDKGKGISHAWFAGYGPIDKPKYVIVVFIERGMSGGDTAAPIFREIFENIN